jgi:glyoxylase-like metal-dependent hydrolase (beta-lactamase superfamily II)
MIQEAIPVGMLQCNCYVLGDEATGDAVVIDPGDDIERVQQILTRHNLKPQYIVATHAHIDHVGGTEKLARATGAAVMMHQADLPLYRNLAAQAAWLGVTTPSTIDVDQFLREGDRVVWGSRALEVLHTPGHSPGSLCLHLPGDDERLFSGDTLFAASIGRTDLWGGSYPEILRSIEVKLMGLPDVTAVFPGHGPATSIGQERQSNPFLTDLA